jgi:poly(A) polymerase
MPRRPDVLAEPGLQRIMTALPETRVVGGAVRDALLRRPVADIDLATPQRPEAVTRALQEAGIRVVPTGIGHGTVTAVVNGRGYEITTLRHDVETDGRHAAVAFIDDWQRDAARRDFTINAMSMARDGSVFDYFGGIGDLRAGRICFVGDPVLRIAEDYLRVLRYFRFFARYAREAPDEHTKAALRAAIPHLARLSAERVWSELKRILAAPDPAGAVTLMAGLGVLAAVMPEAADPAHVVRLIAAGGPPDPLLRAAALLTGDAETFSERMKLSGDERERLTTLRADPVPQPADDDAELRRMLAETDAAVLIGRAWLAGGNEPGWDGLRARLAAMPRPVFPLEGRDVVALGIPPGPRVGALLREVRAWWASGGCTADAAACLVQLKDRIGA